MKFHPSRRGFVSLLFLVLSGASVAYIAFSAWNYLLFYPALNQLQPYITKIIPGVITPLSNYSIDFQVVMDNPAGYRGMTIVSQFIQLYFNASDQYLFQNRTLTTIDNTRMPVGSDSQTAFNISFPLDPNSTASFARFYEAKRNHMTAQLTFAIRISTFLDAAADYIPLERQASASL